MKLLYCERCGLLVAEHQERGLTMAETILCDACREHPDEPKPRRKQRARDSGQIPRAKISSAIRRSGKDGTLPEAKS